MSGPVVAVFAPDAAGHFAPMRGVVAALAGRGARVHVFAAPLNAPAVQAAGGHFVDLFGHRPLEAADDESLPVVSRYVTFAAHYGEEVMREVQELGASLVVYETFAVIGRAVAFGLGLPYVNVTVSHNLPPGPYVRTLRRERTVAPSQRCLRAVEVLRDRFGMADASPFTYIEGLSPYLNVVTEPPQWLADDERAAFEPCAFFGSLPALGELDAPRGAAGFRGTGAPKVYASFGTVPWWYWPELAADGLETIARTLGPAADLLVTLGAGDVPGERVEAMQHAGAVVVPYADTWSALAEADVFVTSNGVNSTHEAVFGGVPMLSYPFHGDQPGLAGFCERHGLAVPLVKEARAPLEPEAIVAGMAQIAHRRQQFDAALQRARGWELEVMARRDTVADRVLAFAQA
jgi:UDP:flavonoid glycosyltransferase YjiC (YdhE family)